MWHICELTIDRIGAVENICRDSIASEDWSVRNLTEKFFEPLEDPNRQNSAVFENGQLIGVCCSVYIPAKKLGGIRFLMVHPDYRNRGIATALLSRAEAWMNESFSATKCVAGATQGNYFYPGINEADYKTRAFFCKRDYLLIDVAFTFRGATTASANAEGALQRIHAGGFSIRPAVSSDRKAVMELALDVDPGWKDELERAFRQPSPSVLVSCMGSSVVAFSSVETNNVGSGVIGPLAVARAFRGRGIAQALFHAAKAALRLQGFDRCYICWLNPALHKFWCGEMACEPDRSFFIYEKRLNRV